MRTLLALIAATMLPPAAADAGDMYYHNGNAGSPVWAVPDTGGQPYVVFSADDIPDDAFVRVVTRYNHVGSYGQSLVVTERVGDGRDLFLYYRDPFSVVHKKRMTAFADNAAVGLIPLVPALGQDDGFFSVVCRDLNLTKFSLIGIDVSIDDVLLDGYMPPTSFTDPRVTLVAERSAIAPDGSSKMQNYAYPHTWSPDGTRVAYMEPWVNASGVYKVSARVKNLLTGGVVTLYTWDMYGTAGGVGSHLRWSPTDNRILGYYSNDGNAGSIFRLDANTPGSFVWVLQRNVVNLSKTSTRYEKNEEPIWRPDGNLIGASHVRLTENRKGANVTWSSEYWSSVLAPLRVETSADPAGRKIPIGWTP